MRLIDKIIIHHSGTADDNNFLNYIAIKNWHIKNKGWDDIGYNFVIEKINNEYEIIKGRSIMINGAHTLGHNQKSIGICCIGNFNIRIPDEFLYTILTKLIKDLLYEFNITKENIYMHKELETTECPGKYFEKAKILCQI